MMSPAKTRCIPMIFLIISAFTHAQVTHKDIEYGNVNRFSLLLDVILPDTSRAAYPVILKVHGGAWNHGNKESVSVDFLVDHGYAVVSINYRLSQDAIFPAQIHECKAAVRWIRANGPDYHLDTLHIGAFGNSAGGHLVALLGTSMGVAELEGDVGNFTSYSSAVHAVCDRYGPVNLVSMCNTSPGHCSAYSPEGQLIGGNILQNIDKAFAASPVTYIDGNEPPFLIMHGTEDPTVPFSQSVELDSLLNAAGQDVIFKPIPGAGHGGAVFRSDSIRNIMIDFFDQHLKVGSSVIEKGNAGPRYFELNQNYPNPFNPSTQIQYSILDQGHVSLKLFNILGQEVKTLVNQFQHAGDHKVTLNGSDLSSGVYVYLLQSGDFADRKKLVVLR